MFASILQLVFFAATPTVKTISACDRGSVLGFPHWWQYLNTVSDSAGCRVDFKGLSDLWLVGLAILEILLRLAGILAVVYIIVAGITYITALGNPERTNVALHRIINALVGLAIVLVAATTVAFLGNTFLKP